MSLESGDWLLSQNFLHDFGEKMKEFSDVI